MLILSHDRQVRATLNGRNNIFDFVVELPFKSLIIEFNGKQHYYPVGWTKESFNERVSRDKDKMLFSEGFGNLFLAIRYDEKDIYGCIINAILKVNGVILCN